MPDNETISISQKKDNEDNASSPKINNSAPASSTQPIAIIQRVRMNPQSFSHTDAVILQKAIGNQAVYTLMNQIGLANSKAVQQEALPNNKSILQGKFESIQMVNRRRKYKDISNSGDETDEDSSDEDFPAPKEPGEKAPYPRPAFTPELVQQCLDKAPVNSLGQKLCEECRLTPIADSTGIPFRCRTEREIRPHRIFDIDHIRSLHEMWYEKPKYWEAHPDEWKKAALDPDNLRAICLSCNRSKGDRRKAKRRKISPMMRCLTPTSFQRNKDDQPPPPPPPPPAIST